MSNTVRKNTNFKPFFKNGKNGNSSTQELPVPLREDGKLIGYKWQRVHLPKLLNDIPHYSPFTDAEEYYFDLAEYDKFINFVIHECVIPEGDYTGLPFIPEEWQWSIFLNTFCWKHKKTNKRRYKEVFIYIPRKNGKTSAFGVIPTLYMFFCDEEKRSQNFCCAADVEQASVNFRHVAFNIESNPKFIGRLYNKRVNRSLRSFEHVDGAMFRVLSSIAETKHGLSPNFVYIDEVHAHSTSDLIDVMTTGTAARSQPLTIYTTTADYDRESVCNHLYDRAMKVAKGHTKEPYFLPVIYEARQDDDFRNYMTWKRANPNFGISIQPDYFERKINECTQSPSKLNSFLRLHLNIKTKTETVWIPPWIWAKGNSTETNLLSVEQVKNRLQDFPSWHSIARHRNFHHPQNDVYISEYLSWYTWYFNKLEQLRDSECWGGFDNSASSDIAAFVLYFPYERCVLPWFWVPAESIERRSKEERKPYLRWFNAGLINNTPMARISEIDIANALTGDEGICHYFTNIQNVAFDKWQTNYIYEMMYNSGIKAESYPLSFAGMNGPCRKIESDITNGELFHGTNPVMDWMNSNAMAVMNNNNQMRIDKNKSTDKVDGMVALAMAIGGYTFTESNTITSLPGLNIDV